MYRQAFVDHIENDLFTGDPRYQMSNLIVYGKVKNSDSIDKGIEDKKGERLATRSKDLCSEPDCFVKVRLKN